MIDVRQYWAYRLRTGHGTGEDYQGLKPVVIIALIEDKLWPESSQGHHRFEFCDRSSGRTLTDTLSIHTVELEKYNLTEDALPTASPLERWVFWLRHAQEFSVEELEYLFPTDDFAVVNSLLSQISRQTRDRLMYDAQEKQRRDLLWLQNIAIQEAEQRGELRGELLGKIRMLREILDLQRPTDEELAGQSLDELGVLVEALRRQIQNRH